MWLLLLILLWLGLEVASLVYASDFLGSGWMALWATLVTSVIGVMVVGRAKHALNPAQIMRSTMQGGNPIKALMQALVPAIAGLMMILPGFFGDAVALLLLFPLTRPLLMLVFGGLLMLALRRLVAKGNLKGAMFMQGMDFSSVKDGHLHHGPRRPGRDTIVDADYRVLDDTKHKS